MPKVFIIILNWNGWRDTIECLESLKELDYENFRIIVVDNGSTDESIQKLEEYRRKPTGAASLWSPELARGNPQQAEESNNLTRFRVYSNESNLGFAGGNNVGIKEGLLRGVDYILLLNNDTVVDKNFLKTLVRAGDSDKKIGILGPIVYFFDEPEEIWFAGGRINWIRTRGTHIDYKKPAEIYPSSEARQLPGRIEKPENKNARVLGPPSPLPVKVKGRSNNKIVDYISGCCLLIKKEVIDQIGLMDEDYFLYYEDTDWCLRGKKVGYQCVLAPSAKIYHKVSQSVAKLSSLNYIYYHTRNGLRMAWRMNGWPKRIVLLVWLSWLFFKQLIKLVICYRKDWARAVIRGIWDFGRGRFGKI